MLDFVLNHIVCLFYNMYIYAYTMEVMTNYATGKQLQPYITCVIEYGHNIYIYISQSCLVFQWRNTSGFMSFIFDEGPELFRVVFEVMAHRVH